MTPLVAPTGIHNRIATPTISTRWADLPDAAIPSVSAVLTDSTLEGSPPLCTLDLAPANCW